MDIGSGAKTLYRGVYWDPHPPHPGPTPHSGGGFYYPWRGNDVFLAVFYCCVLPSVCLEVETPAPLCVLSTISHSPFPIPHLFPLTGVGYVLGRVYLTPVD